MKFIGIQIAVVLLAILFLIDGAPVKKSNVGSDQKLAQIADLAAKSTGNVVTLDDSTYAYYAVTAPCPYSLVVFLTATHPKFRCGVCKQLDKEFRTLAISYSDEMKRINATQNVFFVRLDYESAQKTFQNYQVTSVPLLFHIDRHISENVDNSYQILAREKYQVPADPDAESLANFVKDRTGVTVPIKRSMFYLHLTLIAVFGILTLLVRPVINALPLLISIVQKKFIWVIVSAAIYTCAISGLIFDIIRSPPMYHANPQSGQIMFFYPQSGSQFVVEGFIIGFLNLACAGSLVFLAVAAPRFKTPSARMNGTLAAMAVFGVCFYQIKNLYRMKNRWYGSAM